MLFLRFHLALCPVDHDARPSRGAQPSPTFFRELPGRQEPFQRRPRLDEHGGGIQDHARFPRMGRLRLQDGLPTMHSLRRDG